MTEAELAKLIAALEHLKRPFDRKQISKLPRTEKRPELDYVNHAHVTNRLNTYAPEWSWTLDESFTHGGEFWIRGTMTIYGASRVEFGKGKDPLEAASHFIRRAAMRFGVATDLWAKEGFENTNEASWGPPVPREAVAPESSDAGLAATSGDATAERPGGSEAYGEGATGSPSATSGEVEAPIGGLPPSPDEAHEHVPGKQLASGKFLCVWEKSDGTVCGEPFKPKPAPVQRVTPLTEPVQERADIS